MRAGFTACWALAPKCRRVAAPPSSAINSRRRMSGGLGEDFAADQHAADLAGAGADLVELGVAQQAPGRVFVDVAVAAEDLHRVERDPGGAFGRVEDCAGGILARRLTAVAGARHRIDIGAARVERGVHIGDLRLDQLELADRLAELLTVWM